MPREEEFYETGYVAELTAVSKEEIKEIMAESISETKEEAITKALKYIEKHYLRTSYVKMNGNGDVKEWN